MLLIPTSAFASADGPQYTAGWQKIGEQDLIIYPNLEVYSDVFYSGGGNVEACVYNLEPYNGFIITAYESDNGVLQYIDSYGLGPMDLGYACAVFSGISNYVDGSNGKAEITFLFSNANEPDVVHLRVRD